MLIYDGLHYDALALAGMCSVSLAEVSKDVYPSCKP